MKNGFAGNGNMKPCRLKGMTDNGILQEVQIPAGLIKKSVSIPGRRVEMPEM